LCKAKTELSRRSNSMELSGGHMISRSAKFLSAIAVALIATVAVARTIHTHVAPSGAHVATGKVIGTTPAPTPLHRQGIIVCGMALDANCEKLETLLPM
jgi:hypothetical protein